MLRPTGIFTGVPDTVAGSTSAPVSARLAERPILALQGEPKERVGVVGHDSWLSCSM